MADVARAADLTRQAVYVHFPSRTVLMLALIDHIGATSGARELFAAADATTGKQRRLEAHLHAAILYSERIHDVADALDRARYSDEAARAAWDNRMELRRKKITTLIQPFRTRMPRKRVVEAVVALTSPRLYRELVVERGWPIRAYEEFVLCSTRALITA
jgi:AcrR family transcriptional regulator